MDGSSSTPYRAFDLDVDSAAHLAIDVQRSLDQVDRAAEDSAVDATTAEHLHALDSMFDFGRIQSPFGWRHVLLVLYTPFGILLVLLRVVVILVLSSIVPRFLTEAQMDWVGQHRIAAFLTGTIVHLKDQHNWDRSDPATLVVSNHISEGDIVAVRRVIPSYVLGYSFYKDMLLFRLLAGKFGFLYVPYSSRSQGGAQGRDEIREIIKTNLRDGDKPLLAFPEGGLTNGKQGLMQYHSFLFSLGQRVQPLAIQVSSGPFPVNINDDYATFFVNALWYIFLPYHVYTVRFLPITQAGADETPLTFAQRVMKQTARALHQDATPFLYREKLAYVRYKTKVRDQQQQHSVTQDKGRPQEPQQQ